MSKVDVSLVAETLKKHRDISPATLREIIEELNEITQPSDDDVKPPKAKTQFVVVSIPATAQAWVFQIPESSAPHSIVDRINTAAHAFNASKKGRLLPVKSLAEAVESVPRRFWKDADGTIVKTKLPVALIDTTNKLSQPPTA